MAIFSEKTPTFKWRRWVYDKVTIEDLHVVGGSGEPAFENSWGNFGSSFGSVSFYKNSEDRVFLSGVASSGTLGTAIFTLPSGYRPNTQAACVTISNNAIGRIDIQTDGEVVVHSSVASNVWISLDNISFRTA